MKTPTRRVEPAHVRVVRVGHGANCSSIGSVVDTLFLAGLAGGAVYAALMAAFAEEPIHVVNAPPVEAPKDPDEERA
jgi:hypothetical protein